MTSPERNTFFFRMTETVMLRLAAFSGFSAVALGAFGAHGLQRVLLQCQTVETWKTAVLYHLTHSLLLLFLAGKAQYRTAWICVMVGVLIFSGSLYVLALTGVKWLGAITPLGGMLLLAGWGLLFLKASCRSK